MKEFAEIKEIIPILIFLLPGFLTAKMLDLWVVTKPKDVFDRIVQAFVFTFINLLISIVKMKKSLVIRRNGMNKIKYTLEWKICC